jgi:hypothetical protein
VVSEWTSEELSKIETGSAEDRVDATRRTARKAVTIWVVRHGDQIYVRSVNGLTAGGSWHPDAPSRHIRAGGVTKDVTSYPSTRRGRGADRRGVPRQIRPLPNRHRQRPDP